MSGQLHSLTALTKGKSPGSKSCMGPRADMDALEKTQFQAPLGNRETNPRFFSPNLVTISTMLSVFLD